MIYIGSDKPEVGRTSVWNVYLYYVFFFQHPRKRSKKELCHCKFFFNCVYMSSKTETEISFLFSNLALQVLAPH